MSPTTEARTQRGIHNARRATRIRALAGQLGDGAIAIQADVTDYDSLTAVAGRVKAALGGADVLVRSCSPMCGSWSSSLAPWRPS